VSFFFSIFSDLCLVLTPRKECSTAAHREHRVAFADHSTDHMAVSVFSPVEDAVLDVMRTHADADA
jgi:hypothetical protein